MKLLCTTGLVLAAMAAPAVSQSVEVASGDWSTIPAIQPAGKVRMSVEAFDKADQLVSRDGTCAVTESRVANVTVPFLLEFGPDQSVQRIVVRRVGCPELEQLMGGVVKELAEAGEYKPTGENLANWYRSEISFQIR